MMMTQQAPGSPDKRKQASETEITEWTRMFKIADADGSGGIDRLELRQLMNDLRKDPNGRPQEPIPDHEMEMIYRVMDENHDNLIQLDEFINAMTNFSLKVSSMTGTRNDATFDDSSSTTSKISSSMTNFFQQFERFDPDKILPRVMKRLEREDQDGGDPAEDIDIFLLTGRAPKQKLTSEKIVGLRQIGQMLISKTVLQQWVMQLARQSDLAVVDHHLTYVLEIARVVEWFPTPSDKVDVRIIQRYLFFFFTSHHVSQKD
jgi:Ca2+-binding EF-hand superfamily protein